MSVKKRTCKKAGVENNKVYAIGIFALQNG